MVEIPLSPIGLGVKNQPSANGSISISQLPLKNS